MLSASNPNATWAEWQRMIVIYRFDGLMIGVFAVWISLRYPYYWRATAWLSALAGVVLLVAMYATLWKVVDHRLALGDDSYFARTFRFTFVSLGFAMLLPITSLWQLNRESVLSSGIRYIALWSYALYLVHMPVFEVVTRYLFTGWKTSPFRRGHLSDFKSLRRWQSAPCYIVSSNRVALIYATELLLASHAFLKKRGSEITISPGAVARYR